MPKTVLLTGTYQSAGEVSRRLLDAVEPLTVLDQASTPLVGMLAEEVARDAPGQEAVLDRLLDLLLVTTLRAAFDRGGPDVPAWYRAHDDPVVGPALRLLQDDPTRAWTVAGLATAVGASRAALARRFTEVVGEPPISFLTGWRMALAADLLVQPDTTIGAVADQVGYSSAYALSTAFKRATGLSPRAYRAAA